MKTTIWHNPRCSKSRKTLQILRDHDIDPTIVDYLKSPPNSAEITRLLRLLNASPEAIIRKSEKIYRELNLSEAHDDALIAAMVIHPILIERPIVESNGKAVIGRPPEAVLAII